jgi:hypothetical protein
VTWNGHLIAVMLGHIGHPACVFDPNSLIILKEFIYYLLDNPVSLRLKKYEEKLYYLKLTLFPDTIC